MKLIFLLLPIFLCGCSSIAEDPPQPREKPKAEKAAELAEDWRVKPRSFFRYRDKKIVHYVGVGPPY